MTRPIRQHYQTSHETTERGGLGEENDDKAPWRMVAKFIFKRTAQGPEMARTFAEIRATGMTLIKGLGWWEVWR